MKDGEIATNVIMNFLNNKEKKVLLIKGYDSDAKLKVTLTCLHKKFSKGIIKTSIMSDISNHINSIFGSNILPSKVISTVSHEIENMSININSYSTHTKCNMVGNEQTFSVYYPVQTVLNNEIRYKKLLNELKEEKSNKVIIITTDEWDIENFDIENHVDEIFFYNVENDNPQIIENLKYNGNI